VGQFICSSPCCDGAPRPPTGAESGPPIGGYAEWFTASLVSLTLTADDDGSDCVRTYTSNTVTASVPPTLPSWDDNPLDLDDDEDDWCLIEKDMQAFAGDNGYFQGWKATLDASALQCDNNGDGTDTNTIRCILRIYTTHLHISDTLVLKRNLIITSSDEGCSCFLASYGEGDWVTMCLGNDCCGGCSNQFFALKTDWGGDWGLGSVTQSFNSDGSNPCCEDFDVDWYYIGGSGIEDSVTCPGVNDPNRLLQTYFQLEPPAPGPPDPTNSGGCIHYATKRDVSGDPADCVSYCQITEYGFALALYPAVTDISLETPLEASE
jgi:hypothetical protein